MIQLKKTAKGVELVDRDQTVGFEPNSIRLGQESITRPGEYEVGGASVVFGEKATLLVWEGAQIVYHFAPGKPSEFERSQFSSAELLVLGGALSEQSKNDFTELLEAYDPRAVVVLSETAVQARTQDGFKFEPTKALRLPLNNLPEEGRVFLSLE